MKDRIAVLEHFRNQSEWEARCDADIEKYRKGDVRLNVIDDKGKPIPGVRVHINQKNHAFRFGANLFMLDELETKEKNAMYKTRFSALFNMATLPFYWDSTEPEQGKPRYDKESPKLYRRPTIDLCMEFCEANGIEPREHGLAYAHFFPDWLHEVSLEESKVLIEKHFAEIAERYADRIPTIEVTNEMEWPIECNNIPFYDDPDFVEWCFRTARKYFPNNELVVNEGTGMPWGDPNGKWHYRTISHYYAYVEAAMLKGSPIDGIGMQFHMFYPKEEEYQKTRRYYDPKHLMACMDLYARLGKPLQVTEITIPAYSSFEEDENIQAELIRNLYKVWFSHPSMEQIVYWNLVDGYAYVENPTRENIRASQGNMSIGENIYYGGLLRFDMTPKPAYYALKDLIQNTWHTEETLVSNTEGTFSFRGFYGDYDLEIAVGDQIYHREISFRKMQKNDFTIQIL